MKSTQSCFSCCVLNSQSCVAPVLPAFHSWGGTSAAQGVVASWDSWEGCGPGPYGVCLSGEEHPRLSWVSVEKPSDSHTWGFWRTEFERWACTLPRGSFVSPFQYTAFHVTNKWSARVLTQNCRVFVAWRGTWMWVWGLCLDSLTPFRTGNPKWQNVVIKELPSFKSTSLCDLQRPFHWRVCPFSKLVTIRMRKVCIQTGACCF